MRAGFEDWSLPGVEPVPGFVGRGAVGLGSLLPAIYQELDANAMLLCDALDAVLAPVWLTLDNLDAYLDPALSPLDVLSWVAGWVGLAVDDNWRPEQLRRLVASGVELFRRRGTAKGVRELVEAYLGGRVEVLDNGGVAVSARPGGVAPGTSAPGILVRVAAPLIPAELDRVSRLVRAATPAHVPVRVEVVPR